MNKILCFHSSLEDTALAPKQWQGGLGVQYYLGGPVMEREPNTQTHSNGTLGTNPDLKASGSANRSKSVRLRVFNEAKLSTLYNVVAAIPGTMESDRYGNDLIM